MPKFEFSHRFIFDCDFYENVLKKSLREESEKPPLSTKLTNINTQSKGLKRQHNAMSKRIFDKIVDNHKVSRIGLRMMFFPLSEPEDIESIDDEVERTIKHAIELATSYKPNSVIIMTSDEKAQAYIKNPHFNSAPLVSIKSGNECITLIEEFYKKVRRIE